MSRRSAVIYRLIAVILLLVSNAAFSHGAETVILNITLNQRPAGDFFVKTGPQNDFLIKKTDLKAMGFRDPRGASAEIDGEEYISLKSMDGVTFTYNEKTLSMEITARPELLPKAVIDYTPQRNKKVIFTGDEDSAFFNYRLDYVAGNAFDFQSFNMTNEAGLRTHGLLFRTDTSYTKTKADENLIRLTSNITHDRRLEMERLIMGDFFASSGELGSNLNMGGLSYSKVYRIDPYFIRQPMFNLTGLISRPSDVEVYLDGVMIKREKLSPGEFELKNISAYSGAGNIEVVIKDPFGRVERVRYPFYFADTLLREGLHEFSYNAGFLRKDFGVKSNVYSDLSISAFHRYGWTDSVTAGLGIEAGGGVYNLGPRASWLMYRWGVVTSAVTGSADRFSREGLALSLSHRYQGPSLGTSLLLRAFTRDYSTVETRPDAERPKYDMGAGISYGTKAAGTAGVDYSVTRKFLGTDRRVIAASYTLGFFSKTTLFATYRNVRESGVTSNEVFAGMTYYPWKETSASATFQKTRDARTLSAQLQKNPPVGEGYGYRALVSRADSSTDTVDTVNPFAQYNSRWGIYTAEYRALYSDISGKAETYELTAAGGVAYVGGAVGVSRPVLDSFALVKAGDLKGVRVYNNNQEIGRTDSKGSAFVSDLNSYYDNQLSVNDKDIPINYTISDIAKVISPALRSGSVIEFKTSRIQAVTGKLKIREGGNVKDAEFHDVKLKVDGLDLVFPTGRGGEFYLENIRPGKYMGELTRKGKKYSINILIPESEEVVIDLGDIFLEETI